MFRRRRNKSLLERHLNWQRQETQAATNAAVMPSFSRCLQFYLLPFATDLPGSGKVSLEPAREDEDLGAVPVYQPVPGRGERARV